MKCSRFICGHFLWSFLRASLGKFGQNPSHPPKCACSCTCEFPWYMTEV